VICPAVTQLVGVAQLIDGLMAFDQFDAAIDPLVGDGGAERPSLPVGRASEALRQVVPIQAVGLLTVTVMVDAENQ
jgi:hypothetical protein